MRSSNIEGKCMKKFLNWIKNIPLILGGVSFLFPLYWMISMSFKGKSEVFDNPFGLPVKFSIENYAHVVNNYPFFKYMVNSSIYTVGTLLVTLFCGSLLAYAISRMHWKYSKSVIAYISLGLILPVQVLIVPLYMMMGTLNLRGTFLSLILPYSAFALPSCILMLNAFLRSLPYSLEEAACIDGCSVYQCFFLIILPLITPALITQMILITISTWNEFFLAFVFAGKISMRPITVGLLEFFTSIGVSHWGQIGAAMVMASLPAMVVYFIGNKQIENALTAGAILK